MGNNLFADLLPYKDWCKMNNVQRMHESGNEYTMVFLPNAFICALSYPNLASVLMGGFCIARYNHINSYTTVRGYNNAMITEEMLRLNILLVIFAAMASSLRITGLFKPMWRVINPRLGRIGAGVKSLVSLKK